MTLYSAHDLYAKSLTDSISSLRISVPAIICDLVFNFLLLPLRQFWLNAIQIEFPCSLVKPDRTWLRVQIDHIRSQQGVRILVGRGKRNRTNFSVRRYLEQTL